MLENSSFELESFQFDLTFTFDFQANDSYTRLEAEKPYLEIGVISNPNQQWQRKILTLNYDAVQYNRLTSNYSRMVSHNFILKNSLNICTLNFVKIVGKLKDLTYLRIEKISF